MAPLNYRTKGRNHTLSLILCALFAALTAVLSQIALPLPFTPVPINLATLAVLMAGGLLGYGYGALSMAVYVFMAFCGLPVLTGFSGGPAIVAGPTGGYILGYIAVAFISGLSVIAASSSKRSTNAKSAPRSRRILSVRDLLFMAAGIICCYTMGTLWFMHLTHTGLFASLMSCVVPFLPGDILKILASAVLIRSLRPALSGSLS